MKWLISNPDFIVLSGPQFLAVYGIVIGVIVALATWLAGRDASTYFPPYSLLEKPDPYEIAFLRGGELEVIRLAILDLIRLDFLTTEDGQYRADARIRAKIDPKHADRLSPLLREVFASFASPLTLEDVYQSSLPARVRAHCQEVESELNAEWLLRTPAENRRSVRIGWSAIAILLGIGGYRLAAELSAGHAHVGVLVLLMLIPLPVLVMCCQPRRLSRRGVHYLMVLQSAFRQQEAHRPISNSSEAMMIRVSLFGISNLTHTPLARVEQMFQATYAPANVSSPRRSGAFRQNRGNEFPGL